MFEFAMAAFPTRLLMVGSSARLDNQQDCNVTAYQGLARVPITRGKLLA
jgi:hypothetical protein